MAASPDPVQPATTLPGLVEPVALTVVLVMVTFLLLAGVVFLLLRLWPAPADAAEALANHHRRRLQLAIAVVASLMVAEVWARALGLGPSITDGSSGQRVLDRVAAEAESGLYYFSFTFMRWQVRAFASLVLLVGILRLLYVLSRHGRAVFFRGDGRLEVWLLALLFVEFLVAPTDRIFGFFVPVVFLTMLILLPALLRAGSRRLQAVEEDTQQRNRSRWRPARSASILVDYRRELLDRTWELALLRRRRAKLYDDYGGGTLEQADYQQRRERLDEREQLLRTGPAAVTRPKRGRMAAVLAAVTSAIRTKRPEAPGDVTLRLPDDVAPDRIALSLGPSDSWWDNGITALRLGSALALPAIAYDLVLFFRPGSSFGGVFGVVLAALGEARFWLLAAFILGCLYPYIPGRNGLVKGVVLAACYIAGVALDAVLQTRFNVGLNRPSLISIRSWLLLAYLVCLGVWLDLETLRRNGMGWRQLSDFYQLRDVRTLLLYLSPLVLSILGVVQQVRAGRADQALQDLLEQLPKVVPGQEPPN